MIFVSWYNQDAQHMSSPHVLCAYVLMVIWYIFLLLSSAYRTVVLQMKASDLCKQHCDQTHQLLESFGWGEINLDPQHCRSSVNVRMSLIVKM